MAEEELPKSYKPAEIDQKWQQKWEEASFFKADPLSDKPPYCIVIPPPNITGKLHMGHALVQTLQDILMRWKRMSGFEALWVPGTDHAGIATQTVVERHLMKTEGKRRKEYPRETFLSHVWSWKEAHEDEITNQLKRLGCSCDWGRQRFTMDERNNQAVRTAFKRLYDEGVIYRGDYLVNWDPVTQTALADDEVEYEERDGFLWHFRYPLTDGSGFVEIATTRPETMLGDTAVAVSPGDERYLPLHGKTIRLPIQEREIPLIIDHHVDPEFGTGMVKITPAHDPNDYEMGMRHELPFVNIMTPDGKINENGGEFAGLTMADAREAIVRKMDELGFLVKKVPHNNRVGISYRSKATIEPYMSKQWFVRMSGFATKMRAAVDEKRIKLVPSSWENTYFHWIDNLRDWCISRQLWWGHRIPIWFNKENREEMLCSDDPNGPVEVQANPDAWEQDEDVLDTWFSSALWPFAALGWPDECDEVKRFYPNSVLVTGHDILFFWVARMIMMGEHFMGEVPFPATFLHGLIYGKSYWRENEGGGITYVSKEEQVKYDLGEPLPKDVKAKWEKMSKSKGNVIDPLEIIDEYGTDAMRMALTSSATHARQIDLDRRRFDEFRNFTNKVWNGARFVFMNLKLSPEELAEGIDLETLPLEDRWILSVLNRTVRDVNRCLENYTFDQSAQRSYDFFWKEFCAYYVEISKPYLFGKQGTVEQQKEKQKLLAIVLCSAVRLMHPMAPFITEELFALLKERFAGATSSLADPYTQELLAALQAEACCVAPYPQVIREEDIQEETERTFELVNEITYTIRNIRGEMKVPPGSAVDVFVVGEADELEVLREQQHIITSLVRVNQFEWVGSSPDLPFASTGVIGGLKIVIPLPDELRDQEKKRLEKEQEKVEKNLEKLRAKLANEAFVANAPQELVESQRALLSQNEQELAELSRKLEGLGVS